jgi:dTMP kinase
MKPAKFVTLEGIEGVGKSTQATLLCDDLRGLGVDLIATREPGGTQLGEEIRRLLLGERVPVMHADAELLLMFAARAQHLRQVILPALSVGRWVVCERFTDATYAYQGAGRGIANERIAAMEHWVHGDLQPDLTLLLDAPVEKALARIKARKGEDRFEQEAIDFFVRVRDAYLDLAARQPRRFSIIDADGPMHEVRRHVASAVRRQCDLEKAD